MAVQLFYIPELGIFLILTKKNQFPSGSFFFSCGLYMGDGFHSLLLVIDVYHLEKERLGHNHRM